MDTNKEKEQKQLQKQQEQKQLQKQQEKIDKLLEVEPFKYTRIEELQIDLNDRLKIALQQGRDPLGELSITQIYEDIQTVNKLRSLDIEE